MYVVKDDANFHERVASEGIGYGQKSHLYDKKRCEIDKLILSGHMGSMLLIPQHVGFGDLPDLMVHHLFSIDITTLMHEGNPQMYDKGFVDSGFSRHMTGNIAYLSNFKEFDGGYVTFGGGAYGGRITGKDV
ncbi:hypothetical protein Tco_0378098 [Tanacetum coccineum]